MKDIRALFIKIASVSRMSDDETFEAKIRRIDGFFEVTITDAVTEAVLGQFFIGELVGKEEKRWAFLDKQGTKLRCVARKDNLAGVLEELNTVLTQNGILGFSMETLAELS